jgi:hypothetical protein
MAIVVTDFTQVEARCAALGMKLPEGVCVLPRHFEDATDVSELRHESSALDLKALFRKNGVPLTVLQPEGRNIPYLQQNDITWVGPVLFFGAAALSENAHLLSVSLSVIGNYVTELFRGTQTGVRTKLTVVIETTTTKTTTKTTKKYEYDGPPDKITDITNIIKETK